MIKIFVECPVAFQKRFQGPFPALDSLMNTVYDIPALPAPMDLQESLSGCILR